MTFKLYYRCLILKENKPVLRAILSEAWADAHGATSSFCHCSKGSCIWGKKKEKNCPVKSNEQHSWVFEGDMEGAGWWYSINGSWTADSRGSQNKSPLTQHSKPRPLAAHVDNNSVPCPAAIKHFEIAYLSGAVWGRHSNLIPRLFGTRGRVGPRASPRFLNYNKSRDGTVLRSLIMISVFSKLAGMGWFSMARVTASRVGNFDSLKWIGMFESVHQNESIRNGLHAENKALEANGEKWEAERGPYVKPDLSDRAFLTAPTRPSFLKHILFKKLLSVKASSTWKSLKQQVYVHTASDANVKLAIWKAHKLHIANIS